MSDLNILLVEDNLDDIGVFKSTLELFDDRLKIKTTLKIAKNFTEAISLIDQNIFDGVVLDLYLENGEFGGEEVIRAIIEERKLIIPIIAYTGTPDELAEFDYIEVYRKGESESVVDTILTDLKKTKDFGFNDIFNAKGEIQDFLKNVFYKNIFFQKKQWIKYEDKEIVRKAVLRHALNHLTQYIDETDQEYFLEEVYIYPPVIKKIATGAIVKNPSNNVYYIVLTPACDFAQSKARCILLAEIIAPFEYVKTNVPGCGKTNSRENKLKDAVHNKKQEYHFLPSMSFFDGGFIDFTSVTSHSSDELKDNFSEVKIQISPFFISDILGRFSSYYARQGQPDLKHSAEYITKLLSQNSMPSE